MEDDDLFYLQPDFEPTSVAVPKLRGILLAQGVQYPSNARKADLVALYNDEIAPVRSKLLAKAKRIKRTSAGITNASSSLDDSELMPPPVLEQRSPSKRSGKKSIKAVESDESDRPTSPRKPRRSKDAEVEAEPEKKRDSVKSEDAGNDSVFSDYNPFQSGGSPPADGRRVSAGKKSPEKKRQSVEPSSKGRKYSVPVPKQDLVPAGEEFTPDAQLELEREESLDDSVAVRRAPKTIKPSRVPKSAPWMILLTILGGYGAWYKREKTDVGFCDVPNSRTHTLPDWAAILQPDCEPCPPHATCYPNLQMRCDQDYVLVPHPLSVGGLVPIPGRCEPDGEKAKRIKVVADRAVEVLRERRAQYESGALSKSEGAEIGEEQLQQTVGKKRRADMPADEWAELWTKALEDIVKREEIVSGSDGIQSTSLSRVPLSVQLRLFVIRELATHQIPLAILGVLAIAAELLRRRIASSKAIEMQVPSLVNTTLSRLKTQAQLHAQDPKMWFDRGISAVQLRDDVLHEEWNISKRDQVWNRVKQIVEKNSNIRASVRELSTGEVGRVWEWIGVVDSIDFNRRTSGGDANTAIPY